MRERDRRLGGASTVYPTPRNREIGFVSSSFSFRAVRASGRGEAVRVREGQTTPLSLGLPGVSFVTPSRAVCAQFLLTGTWVLSTFDLFLKARAVFLLLYTWVLSDVDYEYTVIAAIHMGFKRFCL